MSQAPALPRLTRRVVVPLLYVLYLLGFLNIFLRTSIGVMGPEIVREMALTPAMLSAVGSAFFFAYAAMQVPTGMLLDRYGARGTMSVLLVFTLLGVVLFAAGTTVWLLILGRVLMGIGCAGVFIGAFFVLARWYPPDRLVTKSASVNVVAGLGSICAATPLAALIAAIGWREASWLFAGLVVIAAAGAAWIVRDDPPGVEPPAPRRESLGEISAGVAEAMRQPGMRRLAFIGFPISCGTTISGLWGAPYLRDVYGLGEIGRGNVLLLLAVCGMSGHYLYGQLARRFASARMPILLGSIVVALALAMLALVSRPPLFVAVAAFAVVCILISYPGLAHAHARALVPARLAGRGVAAINMGIMSAIAIMQLLFGWIVGMYAPVAGALPEEAYRAGFAVQALVALIALVIYYPTPDADFSAPAGAGKK